jgi:hypothetical protein
MSCLKPLFHPYILLDCSAIAKRKEKSMAVREVHYSDLSGVPAEEAGELIPVVVLQGHGKVVK